MQILIDIGEKDKRYIDRVVANSCLATPTVDAILNAVRNGTPLPKGHGRLIDADAVNKKMGEREEKLQDDRSMWESSAVSTALDMYAPTIIEADEAESEGK